MKTQPNQRRDPTPDEIRQVCAEIQRGWSPQERHRRLRADWLPVVCCGDGRHVDADLDDGKPVGFDRTTIPGTAHTERKNKPFPEPKEIRLRKTDHETTTRTSVETHSNLVRVCHASLRTGRDRRGNPDDGRRTARPSRRCSSIGRSRRADCHGSFWPGQREPSGKAGTGFEDRIRSDDERARTFR